MKPNRRTCGPNSRSTQVARHDGMLLAKHEFLNSWSLHRAIGSIMITIIMVIGPLHGHSPLAMLVIIIITLIVCSRHLNIIIPTIAQHHYLRHHYLYLHHHHHEVMSRSPGCPDRCWRISRFLETMLLFAAKPFTRDALYPELGVTRHFCVEALQLCMATGPEARLRQRAAALVVVWLQIMMQAQKNKLKDWITPHVNFFQ